MLSFVYFLSSVCALSFGAFLLLGLGVTPAGALYIQPPTILSSMKRDLISLSGSCSFPPEDVLSNHESDLTSFGFLEKCNVPLPKPDARSHTHPDAEVLLCMALFDIGLRICGAANMTDHKEITSKLPHNANELQKLLNEGTRPSSTDVRPDDKQSGLCSSLQTVLYEPTATLTKDWNLKVTFQTKKNACSKICFDYDDVENEFCKLIFWGSNLLRETKAYQDYPVHNPSLTIDSKLVSTLNTGNVNNTNTRLENPNGPEIQIVESPPISNSGPETNDKLNSAQLDPLVYNDNTSLRKDENIMKLSSVEHRPNEHQVADGNQKSSSTSSSDAAREKLPAITREQIPTNDGQQEHDMNSLQRRPDSNSETKSSVIETEKLDAGSRSPGKLPPDTETSPEKNVEGENDKTVQSSKSLTSQRGSSSASSITTSESLAVGLGKVQESIQKPEIEGVGRPTNQEVGSEEFANEDLPLDQGEDGDDVNFPNTDLDQPEKTETADDNYFKASRDEITNGNVYVRDRFEESEDSHFFGYFLTMIVFCIVGYLVFHNKQKILALAVEGRSRRSTRRRPNTANYHKLDSNLEEAVSSPCNTSVTHVIY